MTEFKLRPHHLICNLCYQGKGYNEEFINHFNLIHQQINCNNDITIQIIKGCDDICAKCPERKGQFCNNEGKAAKIDNAYLAILQLKIGQTISLDTLQAKIEKFLTMDNFHHACKECSWYHLNLCAPIIRTYAPLEAAV